MESDPGDTAAAPCTKRAHRTGYCWSLAKVIERSALVLLATLTGCQKLAIGAADRSSLAASTQVEACPLGVPETRVDAVETPEGIDVRFSSPPQRIDELRRRVHDQARANGPERHLGEGHGGEHKGPRDHGLRLWSIAPVRTRIEYTATGAKLAIAPVDPSMLADVRARVARRVDHLAKADCVR